MVQEDISEVTAVRSCGQEHLTLPYIRHAGGVSRRSQAYRVMKAADTL